MSSLRAAINAKCKSCVYDKAALGTWRQQVQLCSCVKSCALWPHRPVSGARISEKVLRFYGVERHPFSDTNTMNQTESRSWSDSHAAGCKV